MRLVVFSVLLLLFSWCINAAGPVARFERLSLAQGLSQSAVATMIQDSRGFMWFGTEDGLNRYDGYEFKVFRHDPSNPHSISANHIKALYEDSQGLLWIGTINGGLDRFDPATGYFEHFVNQPNDPRTISNNRIMSLFGDAQGLLWIGTEGGLNRFDGNGFERFVHQMDDPNSLSDNNIRTIIPAADGGLWIGTYGGGLNHFDPIKKRFKHFRFDGSPHRLSNDKVLSLYQDQQQILWVGTEGGGLNRYDPALGQFSHFRHHANDNNSISADEVWTIHEDQHHHFWIGTLGGGLNRFDRQQMRFQHYQYDASDIASLSNNNVLTVFSGQDHILWIGTNGGGINKYDLRHERFGHYKHHSGDQGSLSDNSVFSFLLDDQATLWVGTEHSLDRYDQQSGKFSHYFHHDNDPESLSQGWVMALYQDSQGRFWVGTLGGGLSLFNRQTGRFKHWRHNPDDPTSLSDDRVSVIFEDSRQQLWIGTWSGGLNRFDPLQQRFESFKLDNQDPNSLSHNSLMAINEDPQGNIWVGTFDGLNRFDRDSGKFTRFRQHRDIATGVNHNFITAIHFDSQGIMWIGTYGGGLNRYDRQTQQFRYFRQKQGLVNDSIYGILEDNNGHLWISTNQGLSEFDLQTAQFINYTEGDGLQSNEFNGSAYYKSPTGELFFGGINGFNRFFPPQDNEITTTPNVVLTDFLLFNRSVPIRPSGSATAQLSLSKSIDQLTTLTLNYKHSLVAFEFAALTYTNPEKVQYAFQLQGFNRDWIYTSGKNRRATFTRLPEGDYTLNIKAKDGEGRWLSQSQPLNIRVLPPPWRSWWAYCLYLLSGASLLYVVYWVRQHYSKARIQLLANSQLKQIMQAQLIAGQDPAEADDYRNLNVLLVDNDSQCRQQIRHILEGRQFRVNEAENGADALQLIADQPPFDLVLLDVAMPKLSGYQVCQKIRQSHSANELPVIFMTAKDQLSDMMESFAVGANDYLCKPISGPDLISRIETQLKLLAINRNLTQSNQSIKALSEMCTQISAILDLDTLMDTVYIQVKELMDVDAFALGIYDQPSGTLTFALTIEDGRYLPDYSISIEEKNRPAVWCLDRKEPLIINDYYSQYSQYFGDQPLPQPKAGKIMESFMYWPLLVAGRIVGVLSIQSYRKNAYEKYQLKTIKTLASTAAIALDHAKAYQEMEQQKQAIEDTVAQRTEALQQSNRNIATLSEICSEISSTLDYNKILHTVYHRIKALMDADIFMIGLYNSEKNLIEFKLAIKRDKVMPPFVLNTDDQDRVANWCFKQQQQIIVNQLDRDLPQPVIQLPIHQDNSGREIESFMYYPLMVHGEIIGVLTVQSYQKNAYNERQQDMMGTIASTTAIALDNANAYRELAQKNNQILATQKKLIQSENLASLGTLTAGIAHEINNPTNFVHVSSQNLEVDLARFHDFIFELAEDDADQDILDSFEQQFKPLFDHITTIKEGTERIKTIVKDLRGFSYLDNDEKTAVDLTEMLLSTINLAKTKYAQLAIFTTDFTCQPQLLCYPAKLNQVFMNLIVNACDAIRDKQRAQHILPEHAPPPNAGANENKEPNQTRPGHIVIGCYSRGDRIDITVRDDGCGMDERTIEKLFVPFYTTKQVGEGTGLGLSISYNIVQKHDGELTVKSELGVGTEFRLSLPVN